MCGRYTLTLQARIELADALGVPVESLPGDLRIPRYNVAPTDSLPIVRQRNEDRQVLTASWGLVNSWAKDAKRAAAQINARAESLERLPAFRDAFDKRRCVVPADGFFEWLGAKGARRPIWFHREDGKVFLFAGLYESWKNPDGDCQRTFTIVTTTANDVVAPVHDRMPVILDEDAADAWLYERETDHAKLLALLQPAPDSLLVPTPVSPRANSVKNDDPDCLSPMPALL